jgi:SAM-dependent methyltransferase
MRKLDYVAVDLQERANIDLMSDLTATPIQSGTFDAAICVHVLEHVEDDRLAIQELFRLLKPGSWAVVSVPIRLDQKTFEDPSITAPEARRKAFGETSHVRFYGYDFAERLETCGFKVQLDLGKDIDRQTMDKYGLKDDENIYYCTKA